MNARTMGRNILPLVGVGVFCWGAGPAMGATQHFEKHFPVKGHPVVCIHNIGDGRIEVKSTKNSEVIVAGTKASSKVSLDADNAGDRIDVSANVVDVSAQPGELQVNFQLSVPEETELELKTQTG